jgi:hypothetical protein
VKIPLPSTVRAIGESIRQAPWNPLHPHRHCRYVYLDAVTSRPPYPVRQIPARQLQKGMTLVCMPEDWMDVSVCCGHWPVIIDEPRYLELGEGGEPCVYWTTDEPSKDDGDRAPYYWALADLPVTIKA